tara:strand:- start:2103 stop:3353 length:1251 start_codon:yes stop_codon:yes gene_type:complete
MKNNYDKPWILIAAYDLSAGNSSEGHIAYSILNKLLEKYRIIMVTRCNNKKELLENTDFTNKYSKVYLVGYDLPRWASWWKKGARFYRTYAYFWQMTWPFVVKKHLLLKRTIKLIHILNFHNDSIPSLAWILRRPVIWGPINHHEIVPPWRRTFWPKSTSIKHVLIFFLRRILWRIDFFLRIHIYKSDIILSAGKWVDNRLGLKKTSKIIHRSQLGFNPGIFHMPSKLRRLNQENKIELIIAGRLDWIKGIDLAIEALAQLPLYYCLKIIGKGPSEQKLRTLAARLGIKNRIVFQPPVSRNELSDIYANSDVFLFTSAEVAGLVWIEALACGLPVVAFDGNTEVAAAANYIPNINLALKGCNRKKQIQNLARAITKVSKKSQNSSTTRDALISHYSYGSLAAIILKAYDEVSKNVN